MMIDVFWQRIEAMMECDSCGICPVLEYAHETNTEPICEKIGDCADGLKMLHKKLQTESEGKNESI